jgi:hypothetical protein
MAERFEVITAHVTVEDLDLFHKEEKFLKEEGYTTIIDYNETQENLVEIPSQVAEMDDPNEVTLIIMMNCMLYIHL